MRQLIRRQEPLEEPVPDYDAVCECGHRHAEHSLFGSCHGCNDCSDDPRDEHDHPYERCQCADFRLATEVTADSAPFALTG